MVELFLPVSTKIEMNMECRKSLLKMEIEGGLSDNEKISLQGRLSSHGLSNIIITGTAGAKQGNELNLRVESDYVFSKFSGLFAREDSIQRMVYDKTSVSRKVVN